MEVSVLECVALACQTIQYVVSVPPATIAATLLTMPWVPSVEGHVWQMEQSVA